MKNEIFVFGFMLTVGVALTLMGLWSLFGMAVAGIVAGGLLVALGFCGFAVLVFSEMWERYVVLRYGKTGTLNKK